MHNMSEDFTLTTDEGLKAVHENHAIRLLAQEFRRMGEKFESITIDKVTTLKIAGAMDALVNRAENATLLLGMALSRPKAKPKRRVDWDLALTIAALLVWVLDLVLSGALAAAALHR